MKPQSKLTILLLVAIVALAAGCGRDPKPLEPGPNPAPYVLSFTDQGRLMAGDSLIDVGIWGVPDLADIDNDNDLDLFIGDWWGTIWFYRNNGTPGNSLFQLETNAYKQFDVGRSAAPEFVDIDADGDLDLFVGTGYSVGYGESGLWFFRNVGSPTNDTFELVSENYPGLSGTGVSKPAFGDLDGDGDLDLLFGHDAEYPDGLQSMVCFRNDGTPQEPNLVLDTIDYLPSLSGYTGRSSGRYIYPTLYDLDRDGDLDMLTGYYRELRYYRNEGTNSAPVWTLTDLPKGVSIYPTVGNVVNVVDLNGDGRTDLAIGTGYAYAQSAEDKAGVTYYFRGE